MGSPAPLPLTYFLFSLFVVTAFVTAVYQAVIGVWGINSVNPSGPDRKSVTIFWVLLAIGVVLAVLVAWGTARQLQQADLDKRTADAQYGDIHREIAKLALAANLKTDQSPAEIVKEAISLLPKAAIDVTSGIGNLSGNANTTSIGQSGGQTIGSANQGINTIGQVGNNTIVHGPHQRHLTARQFNELKATARGTCGNDKFEVTAANSDHEAQVYAMDFVNSLKGADCSAELVLPTPGLLPTVTGIHIGIRPAPVTLDNLKSNNPGAYFLNTALTYIGIHPEYTPLDPIFFANSKFVLVIGGEDSKDVAR